MAWQVYIAHANGEEQLAEHLAEPIREAGYEVVHRGTALVGESIVEEALKVLSAGNPVVLCGTAKAAGTRWARQIVSAVAKDSKIRVFVVQMDEEAYVDQLAFGGTVALYWENAAQAFRDLIVSLQKCYPIDVRSAQIALSNDAERRYRDLSLESCDIINLANLPETDRHIATRQLELRRLYVPLRVQVEIASSIEASEKALEAVEKRRLTLRQSVSSWNIAGIGKYVPIGEQLATARRLVVLGDPGAGKTTLVKWIATAYLLRLKHNPDWKDLPDVTTLPDEDWLPILIRCRDLDQPSLSGSFNEILHYTLRKAELMEAESSALCDLLRERLHKGQALLLLDGLDEIKSPVMRARFCRQIEQFHIAHPNAPIVATSRIVGYREIGYRIGQGFEHVILSELSKEDKDDFVRRWCAVNELPERREVATAELIHDIHSTDGIERLTGNPMMLTTLVLVKRKVGRFPSRRADLYWEAVQVLLNWRRQVDEPLDQREALPQLEYLAYAMCDRGVQQLREDEIIELFEHMRADYPSLHTLRKHTSEEFLRLLERHTGILVEAGHVRYLGRPVPVFEFQHLTFQEYLAGLALVDGRFPGRDLSRSLAEHIGPLLARQIRKIEKKEVAVTEIWHEVLRLCVSCCKDDDVDSVLLAILKPLPSEDAEMTTRPRAILAAFCLADEPNASEEVAKEVLREFAMGVGQKDDSGNVETTLVMELATSRWSQLLRSPDP